MTYERVVNLDRMRIELDVPVEMDDGLVLRADVFRPAEPGAFPVILSYGPYGKWMHFGDGSPRQWERLISEHPEAIRDSSTRFACYEVVDPDIWIPDGYICVRVDSRGAGRSPGYLEPWSPRETQDLYRCIEWAGSAEWSSGRVGLSGISYYAMNQWQVAALRPPHLAAMIVWEGASDLYRDLAYHGGILCTFADLWYQGRVVDLQHGHGDRGPSSRMTGQPVTGPEELDDVVLDASRTDFGRDLLDHPLIDDYWRERIADLEAIEVPFLSAGNLSGAGLHLRGNVEGFVRAAAREKWLELHGLEHWTHFYTDYGVDLQKRFFGHFLKEEDTGWDSEPRVRVQVRNVDGTFKTRAAESWPLENTEWTKLYFDASAMELSKLPPEDVGEIGFEPLGDGATFLSPPLTATTEIVGPIACKLFISSDSEDADIFVVVRAFTADMAEVTFQGANEPNVPVAQGWLRASHRVLDPALSEPHRPFHKHERREPLTPGEIYELDIEVWPTGIRIPHGYRIGVSLRGRDYQYRGSQRTGQAASRNGIGPFPFRHDSHEDRANALANNGVTIHCSPERPSHVLLPIIP